MRFSISSALPRTAVLLGALALAPSALAQTGKIAGQIVDQLGETVPGVNVVVVGTTLGAVTDVDGYFAILGLRPGTYAIRASSVGYTPTTVENLRVYIDRTTEANLTLREADAETDEVLVTAERPLVQRDLTSTSTSVSADELAALPVQSFSDVVNLQAGVVEGHFRGGRTGEVAYMVDGVPVNDVYDQSFAYQVENNAIQEVEVISGTFNAEYGQAQSGVVNIVTKDGGDRYEGSLSGYTGGYATTRTDLFPEAANLFGAQEVQGNVSGPVPGLGRRLTFFASGRYVRNAGYLYGQRIVQPVYAETNARIPVEVDGRTVYVPALGDSTWRSLNQSEQATAQLKLTARVFGQDRLSISGLWQRDEGVNFNPLWRYNPDGVPTVYGASSSVLATYNHLFSTKTFVDVKGAYFDNAVSRYVYEDSLDTRYGRDTALRELAPSFAFYLGGVDLGQFRRRTRTAVARVDVTSQVTRTHLVKGGVEFKHHRLTLDDFQVKNNADTGFQPAVPAAGTPDHVRYEQTPIEASAYVQDKLELGYFVLNVGVRGDYFDARTTVPEDFSLPRTGERRATSAKIQLSPRVGLAYPLSERGVVHVAYGHFFQMPPFDYLFTNPDYIYDPEQGLNRAFGYADLEPQKTVAYEVGLQYALSRRIGLDLTVYYKDITNLLGTRLETIAAGAGEDFQLARYGRYINRDYGQVKGFIAAFEQRATDSGIGLRVDYTFQIARGSASDPQDVLLREAAGQEPEKQLVPLDWDRRHQLNAQLSAGQDTRGLGLLSLVARLGSGLPYTPSQADERTGLENSARRPGTFNLDLFLSRRVRLGTLRPGLFLRVYNVFDTANVRNVYTDTGTTDPNLRYYAGQALGLNTKAEYLLRPDFYEAPRMVQVGASVTF